MKWHVATNARVQDTFVFSALNELSLYLQGRGLNIVTASEKLATFKEKLTL